MIAGPLHILHVFASFCPGGAQMRFVSLANALGRDVAYTIVAMDGRFDAAKLLDPAIRVSLVPPGSRGLPWSALAIRRLLREVRPDLTITNNWGSMDAVLGSWSAGLCPTIHSEDGFNPDEVTRLKFRRVLTRRVLLNRIHTTVVPSKALLRIARERYRLAEDKVTLIPNGIDVARFRPTRCEATRTALRATENTVIVGFVGHLRAEKDLPLLLRAYAQARLPDARLVIAGDGPARHEVETLAEAYGSAVSWCSPATRRSRRNIFPHLTFLRSRPPRSRCRWRDLKAMAFGYLPVDMTDVGDCADMLCTRDPAVYCAPGNLDAYVRALTEQAQSPKLRQTLGAANRQNCVRRYSFEAMLQAYVNLYEDALSGKRSP